MTFDHLADSSSAIHSTFVAFDDKTWQLLNAILKTEGVPASVCNMILSNQFVSSRLFNSLHHAEVALEPLLQNQADAAEPPATCQEFTDQCNMVSNALWILDSKQATE